MHPQAALSEAELRIRNLSDMLLSEEQQREGLQRDVATATASGRDHLVQVRARACVSWRTRNMCLCENVHVVMSGLWMPHCEAIEVDITWASEQGSGCCLV